MIVESKPWYNDQPLTHTDGRLFIATGAASFKPAPVAVLEPPEEEPARQTHFFPGDVLPDWMSSNVDACLSDGSILAVYDGEELPPTADGVVIIDAVTGKPTFNQKPVKLEDQRQTVYGVGDTLPEWMVGKVNVCLLETGEVVELCDDEEIPANIDGTVILDALTGVPTYNQGAQKPVEVVKPLVEQSDEPTKEQVLSGVCLWRNTLDGCLYTVTIELDESCTWFSSDKNDTNTFGTVIEAPSAGVDDYGKPYVASQDLIVWADNTVMAMTVDTDTVDGYSEQGVSDGSQLDAQGNSIPDGNKITTYYDSTGAVVNSRDDEKTQGSTTTPTADGLGNVIKTSDDSETFVCDRQAKEPKLNVLTNMYELLDQNGDPMGASWFSVSPQNRVKNQIITVDGEVTDGNGVSVSATGLGGAAIVQGGLVAVECDPDGDVVTVAVFPVDTTVLSENESAIPFPINPATGNQVLPDPVSILKCDGTTLFSDGDLAREVGHGLVRLPTIASPLDCVFPDAPCIAEGYILMDEYGHTREKAPGAAVDAWVEVKKGSFEAFERVSISLSTINYAEINDAANITLPWLLLDEVTFTVVNPTCDTIDIIFSDSVNPNIHVEDGVSVILATYLASGSGPAAVSTGTPVTHYSELSEPNTQGQNITDTQQNLESVYTLAPKATRDFTYHAQVFMRPRRIDGDLTEALNSLVNPQASIQYHRKVRS